MTLRVAATVALAAGLGCSAVQSAVCEEQADKECPDAVADEAVEGGEAGAETKETEPPGPTEAQCQEFIGHMAVVTAQGYGLEAQALFPAAEREAGVKHCMKFAHPLVIECGLETHVNGFMSTCLMMKAKPRPRLANPSREDCERVRDRTMAISNELSSRAGGYAPPQSARAQERMVTWCADGMASKQVQCGMEAKGQLDLWSCFSPYKLTSQRTWPTAEECEAYAPHMLELLRVVPGSIRPVPDHEALVKSGLLPYAAGYATRAQILNLCHSLDRDMVQCHRDAKQVVDLSSCAP